MTEQQPEPTEPTTDGLHDFEAALNACLRGDLDNARRWLTRLTDDGLRAVGLAALQLAKVTQLVQLERHRATDADEPDEPTEQAP